MPKFAVWVSFPLEIEADDEDDARDAAIETLRAACIESDINIPAVLELEEEEDA